MKWFGWFTKLTFTAIVVSGLSVTTTYVMINLYVDQLLQQMNISSDSHKVSFSELLTTFSGQENTIDDKKGGDHFHREKHNSDEDSDRDNIDSILDSDHPGLDPSDEADALQMDAVEVWNHSSSNSEFQDALIMSSEDFIRKRDQLSDEDKMKIFSTVITKIPPETLQKLSELMEDGVTAVEFAEIQTIIQQYLNDEEYRELIALLNKYMD